MQKQKKYLRLSADEKKALIERSLNGEAISLICKEAGISRTIFYKWLSANQNFQKKSLLNKSPKQKKHWRKQKTKVEQAIIRLWRSNPELSIRDIAKKTGVSTGGAFNIINKYKIQLQNKGKKIKRYKKKSYNIFGPEQKKELINRYYEGDSIVKICHEAGISRTIFYRWLKKYAGGTDESVLARRYRRAEKHWRFIPGVRDLLLKTISENPDLSLSQLAIEIKNKGENVSRSGLYYILKGMNMTTYETRLAYARASAPAGSQGVYLPNNKQEVLVQLFGYVPGLAVFTLFWMIVSFVSLNSLVRSVEITGDIASNITPTIAEGIQEIRERVMEKGNTAQRTVRELIMPKRADQDLANGAVSVNVAHDSLKPGQESSLGFGLVDSLGNTVCDAEISFEVYVVRGERLDGGVARPSGLCSLQSVTNTPDYAADIRPFEVEGEYRLHIKARTYEGEKEIERTILVENGSYFEIERASYPSRIYPLAKYPVKISIKANEEFHGTISDTLPKGIVASGISGEGIFFRKVGSTDSVIKWRVNLKKGEVYEVSYILHFPQVWPELYEAGPIELTEAQTGKVVYREARYWQVAADAL
jgi:transposase